MSALPPKSDIVRPQQRVFLFDHLIGCSKQRRWDLETKRLGSFAVNGRLEFGWLLYRQITWLGALQNLIHGCSAAAERIRPIRSIGHQTTSLDRLLAKNELGRLFVSAKSMTSFLC